LSLVISIYAADYSWKDDFSYSSLQEMQNAGWILENPSGTRMESEGVVIDGTGADTVIRYRDFPDDIEEWSVETRSMWLGVGHSGPGLNVITEKHTYGASADGWYNDLNFDRDGEVINVGSYTEQANVWVTMTLIKKDDNIKMYFNGELVYTYVERDTSSSELIGVDRIAPWHGVMLYDYYQVKGPDVLVSSDFPVLYVAVGGAIGAIVVIGAVVYFFFISGSAATVAATAGATATTIVGTASANSITQAMIAAANAAIANMNLDASTASAVSQAVKAGVDAALSGGATTSNVANSVNVNAITQSVLNAVDAALTNTNVDAATADAIREAVDNAVSSGNTGGENAGASVDAAEGSEGQQTVDMEFNRGAQEGGPEDIEGSDMPSQEQNEIYDDN
jgi:hypothetical protein